MHDHLRQQRQGGSYLAPDPSRQIFAGRILETRNIIQIPVIDLVKRRLERTRQIREVLNPPAFGTDGAAHAYFNAERVPVQTSAFVLRRYVGKVMCRLDGKNLENFHDAKMNVNESSLTVWTPANDIPIGREVPLQYRASGL